MDKCEKDLHKVPITALTSDAKNLLSILLNAPKVLLSDTTKHPRDWRGLATLVGISFEIANSYEAKDKTVKVLQYWLESRNGDATVGQLLKYMQDIDRFDVFDDLMELLDEGKLLVIENNPPLEVAIPEYNNDILTFDDKIHGAPQFYHAYVLYARQDQEFVVEMLRRMHEKGLKLCTEDDLLPDFETTYTPVSRLISSDRCHRTILVYSPDFLDSPANNFFMNYAQAVGIEKKAPKIVPVMYRDCQLPKQLTYYHKLYYEQPDKKPSYDFWTRLCFSLTVHQRRINGTTNGTSNSAFLSTIDITEVNSGYQSGALLALPPRNPHPHPHPHPRSTSESGLDRIESNNLNNREDANKTSVSVESKKKKSLVKNIMNSFTLNKKKKKVLVVAD